MFLLLKYVHIFKPKKQTRKQPLTSYAIKRLTNLSEGHVLFDGVDARLEVGPGSVHVGDHRADITNNGGKDQHTNLEEQRRQYRKLEGPEKYSGFSQRTRSL